MFRGLSFSAPWYPIARSLFLQVTACIWSWVLDFWEWRSLWRHAIGLVEREHNNICVYYSKNRSSEQAWEKWLLLTFCCIEYIYIVSSIKAMTNLTDCLKNLQKFFGSGRTVKSQFTLAHARVDTVYVASSWVWTFYYSLHQLMLWLLMKPICNWLVIVK